MPAFLWILVFTDRQWKVLDAQRVSKVLIFYHFSLDKSREVVYYTSIMVLFAYIKYAIPK